MKTFANLCSNLNFLSNQGIKERLDMLHLLDDGGGNVIGGVRGVGENDPGDKGLLLRLDESPIPRKMGHISLSGSSSSDYSEEGERPFESPITPLPNIAQKRQDSRFEENSHKIEGLEAEKSLLDAAGASNLENQDAAEEDDVDTKYNIDQFSVKAEINVEGDTVSNNAEVTTSYNEADVDLTKEIDTGNEAAADDLEDNPEATECFSKVQKELALPQPKADSDYHIDESMSLPYLVQVKTPTVTGPEAVKDQLRECSSVSCPELEEEGEEEEEEEEEKVTMAVSDSAAKINLSETMPELETSLGQVGDEPEEFMAVPESDSISYEEDSLNVLEMEPVQDQAEDSTVKGEFYDMVPVKEQDLAQAETSPKPEPIKEKLQEPEPEVQKVQEQDVGAPEVLFPVKYVLGKTISLSEPVAVKDELRPEVPEILEVSEAPVVSEVPEVSMIPGGFEVPDVQVKGQVTLDVELVSGTQVQEVQRVSMNHEFPQVPENPEEPEVPEVPKAQVKPQELEQDDVNQVREDNDDDDDKHTAWEDKWTPETIQKDTGAGPTTYHGKMGTDCHNLSGEGATYACSETSEPELEPETEPGPGNRNPGEEIFSDPATACLEVAPKSAPEPVTEPVVTESITELVEKIINDTACAPAPVPQTAPVPEPTPVNGSPTKPVPPPRPLTLTTDLGVSEPRQDIIDDTACSLAPVPEPAPVPKPTQVLEPVNVSSGKPAPPPRPLHMTLFPPSLSLDPSAILRNRKRWRSADKSVSTDPVSVRSVSTDTESKSLVSALSPADNWLGVLASVLCTAIYILVVRVWGCYAYLQVLIYRGLRSVVEVDFGFRGFCLISVPGFEIGKSDLQSTVSLGNDGSVITSECQLADKIFG
jgi:hypothetical protein